MPVEVGVRELRSRLSYWLGRAADGEEIVVTERGKPRARITGADSADRRQRLIDAGLLTPARRPKRTIRLEDIPEIPGLSLSEILMEQRRSRDY